MYKVLIVDDEVLVRVGLKNTINWESIGFTVVGEASNGEQGYAQVIKLEPDVVITDIKMPKKDGLWLTEKINKEKRKIKTLVLTSYDDFNYARLALKNGATDYILKAEIVDDELIALMTRVKGLLDEENAKNKLTPPTLINQNAIKRSLLNDLIKTEFVLEERLIERLEAQNFKMDSSQYAFIYLENRMPDQSENTTKKQISKTIISLFTDQFNERNISYLYNGYMDEHLFLIASDNLSLTVLKRLCNTVENGIKQYFGLSIHLVYTNIFGDWSELKDQHENLMTTSKMMFYIAPEETFVENIQNVKMVSKYPLKQPERLEKPLIEMIRKEDHDTSMEMIRSLITSYYTASVSPKALKRFILKNISEIYETYNYIFEFTKMYSTYEEIHDVIQSAAHVDILTGLISGWFKVVIEAITLSRGNSSNYIVNEAIYFVEQNYSSEISLDDVAKAINLSKQYVCMVFKKTTGENLSHFINNMRIEKAKQLLLNPEFSNKDIYEVVGFSNPQYFSRVFKKVTGMTTSEFKRQNSL
ncbi:MAG: response regulator [Clostridiales bacterium]|nr:response regulator [Clostridiales bacterium]